MTWNGNAALDFDIGTTSDLLALSGALTKGTAGTFTFDFTNLGAVGGTSYTLATFASTTFSSTDFSASGLSGTFAIVNSDSLVFTEAVPEPATWALLLGGSALLFLGLRPGRAAGQV